MYKLLVSDLDGTLLNAEHRLGDDTREVLLALIERGIGVILASGRHVRDIRSFSRLLGGRIGLISSNGAAVHDPRGRLTDTHPVDPSCLQFLLRDPLFDGVHTSVYRADDWLVDTPEPRLLRYHQASGFAYRVLDFAAMGDEPVLKVFYYHEDVAHLRTLETEILERHAEQLTTTYALPVVLEVMARGVSKGAALARIAARLGIQPEEIIAFGDGRNDLEMLSYAGRSLLMANADPWLKAALPDVERIASNAEEAVAHYLAARLL
ncbi:Cof-type HAD-IIB family hydrolase [Thiocystis violacea]|uniref:Cof-type HAD-IIB family hydrolase n=1 Tax=Thiocystis violacea TaxID=13725 RepID=UPI00190558F8|nr:Cof-type HAD-IIB family hydrolase [Thiocystis violacea]MBK1722476.1 hydrolase Cof [Thiocystis violacea]